MVGSRGGVGVRIRSKIIVRSGVSLGLGLGWGLIPRSSIFMLESDFK